VTHVAETVKCFIYGTAAADGADEVQGAVDRAGYDGAVANLNDGAVWQARIINNGRNDIVFRCAFSEAQILERRFVFSQEVEGGHPELSNKAS
jgi:hypothetical protein